MGALAPTISLSRADIPSGAALELSGRYRAKIARGLRFELGLEARYYDNGIANHYALGIPLELDIGVTRKIDITLAMIPHYDWINFNSSFFQTTNAWATRFEAGLQGKIGQWFMLGGTPFAFNVLSAETTGVITTWEPKIWGGVSF